MGGELCIQQYDCTMKIPEGALDEGDPQTISVQILTKIPSDLVVQEDEIVGSHPNRRITRFSVIFRFFDF